MANPFFAGLKPTSNEVPVSTSQAQANPFFQVVAAKTQEQNIFTGFKPLPSNGAPLNPFFQTPERKVTEIPLFGQSGKADKREETKLNPFLQASSSTWSGTSTAGLFSQPNPGNVFGQQMQENAKPTAKQASSMIQLKNVPKKFYAREFLMEFYSEFGIIIKVNLLNDASSSAIVKFLNQENATKALEHGKMLGDGEDPVEIEYYHESVPPKFMEKQVQVQQGTPKKIRHSIEEIQLSLEELVNDLQSQKCVDPRSKYELLDTIDREIRKNFHRDRQHYKALRGTCMDMCPEKERYQREDRNQTSYYELGPVDENSEVSALVLDPSKAVKEYSRSSADQEEPLPHELRPPIILQLSMDYLIQKVMDISYTSRSDWFDFVWNRTRAIRKDITQQNLSCRDSIDLVEKCVRFHIFCSHHLCEQDLNVFDPKINLENLTKCLQTLKHMYEDRWKNGDYQSENEAEFRAYQILLNLNDSDTLREVMAFKEEIRKAKPVKFALQVLFAVQDNNYIRFFKLLKISSFLNACLMHAYFNQIRANALRLMTSSFSVPKADVEYPLSNLQRLLAFSDMEVTEKFCSHYGCPINEEYVLFNRTSFINPEIPFPKRKSVIINEKCIRPLAEVINGRELSDLKSYTPSNSFNTEGYYVGTYHDISNIVTKEEVENKEIEKQQELEEDPIPESFKQAIINPFLNTSASVANIFEKPLKDIKDPDYKVTENEKSEDSEGEESQYDEGGERRIMILREGDNEINKCMDPSQLMKHIIKNGEPYGTKYSRMDQDIRVFGELFIQEQIEMATKEFLSEALSELKFNLTQCDAVAQQFIAIECIEKARDIAKDVIVEENDRCLREQKAINEKAKEQIAEEYMKEHINKVLKHLCTMIYREEEEVIQKKVEEEISKTLCDETVALVLKQEISKVANETLNVLSDERERRLESRHTEFKRRKLQRLFTRWKKAFKYQVSVKHTLHEFPPAAPFFSLSESVEIAQPLRHKRKSSEMYEAYDVLRGGQSKTKALITNKVKEMAEMRKTLKRKIKLTEIIKEELLKRERSGNLQTLIKGDSLKIGLRYINSDNQKSNEFTVNDIVEKLSSHPIRDGDSSRLLHSSVISLHQSHFPRLLKNITFLLKKLSQHSLYALHKDDYSAIVYFIDAASLNIQEIAREIRSLNSLRLPIVVHVLSNDEVTPIIDNASVVHLYKNVKMNELNEEKIISSLRWLVERAQLKPSVIKKSLSLFTEDALEKLFFKQFRDHCLAYQAMEVSSPAANDVIGYYNNSIEAVAQLACCRKGFNEEGVHQNDTESLKQMENLIKALRLSELPLCDNSDWGSCYEVCIEYINKLNVTDAPVLCNRINLLLETRWSYKSQNIVQDFPWPEILDLCMVYVSKTIHGDPNFNTPVYYYASDLEQVEVGNPMKKFMKEHSICRSVLDASLEYRDSIKRRKYSREHRLRNAVQEVNSQLQELQETIKKRKSSSRSSLNISLPSVLEETTCLMEDIQLAKYDIDRSYRHLSDDSNIFQISPPKIEAERDAYTCTMSDIDISTNPSLEESVVGYLKDVANTKDEIKISNLYWQKILEG